MVTIGGSGFDWHDVESYFRPNAIGNYSFDENNNAGVAFAKAVSKQPELNLYAPDKRHPSLAGTYPATCVVFAALTGRSPVGNTYLATIDPQTATFLQNVAGETVQEYYGK
jgi:hypothetical protein